MDMVMSDDEPMNRQHLRQPGGKGTAINFKMPTPRALVGRTNPRTGRVYGKEIVHGLSTRSWRAAEPKRDLLLGLT